MLPALVFVLLDSADTNARRIRSFESGIIIFLDVALAMIADAGFGRRAAIIGFSIARVLRYRKAA
jgi:hypothetical protein